VKVRNCHYSVSGSQNIKLVRACDDGTFTFLEFAVARTIPPFSPSIRTANESVVNFRMEGKYVVIERVGSLFTLRDGNEALCLFNEDRPFQPREAKPRTSIKFKGKS